MKKLFLLVFLICSLTQHAFADFTSHSGISSAGASFSKPSGVSSLSVYEDYIINPFKNANIVSNTTCINGICSITNYMVDGRVFNSSHPLYRNYGNIRKNWSEESDGISTQITYRDNTHYIDNGVIRPNQQVSVRKYYSVTFRHDTSTPTCGEVKYYNDVNLSQAFTYGGGWLNREKYFTMICEDSQTECYCAPDDSNCIISGGQVVSSPQLLGHNIRPFVSFSNNVKLTDTSCQPGGTFQKVLYDLKTPKLEFNFGSEDLDVNIETNRNYEVVAGKKLDGVETPGNLSYSVDAIHKKVGDTSIVFDVEDVFLSSSVHGVSGIKSYDFTVLRNTNSAFENLSIVEDIGSCGVSRSFSEYNADGTIEITDTYDENITCDELLKSGEYSFVLEVDDWAGNKTKLTIPVFIYPGDFDLSQSTITVSEDRTQYANDSDNYIYELTLRDGYRNPLFNRRIDAIKQDVTGYAHGKTLNTKNGDNALKISVSSLNTDNEGKISFNLSSLVPGEYSQRFGIGFRTWGDDYVQDGLSNTIHLLLPNDNAFLKPFSASLSLVGPGTVPEVGTLQTYQIDLNNVGSVSSLSLARLRINNTSIEFDSQHNFDALLNIDNRFNLSDPVCSFDASLNVLDPSAVLSSPVLAPNNMPITYRIGGKEVEYTLDRFSLSGCDKETLGLKVIGNLQGDGKSDITGQESNFSDVSQFVLGTQIQKNAVQIIKGMNSGDIINNVRFVEGDVSIGGEITDHETLIVKNGNVFISSDLNTAKRKFGIIVLKDDGYNLESDYNDSGNVYIGKDVENIHVSIYADGTLRSAQANGTSYSDAELSKKLYILGGIFTRNTIGGAVAAGSDLLLPGGDTTSNVDLAKVYDLNYLRKTNICGDEYSTLIEYDPNIQLDPPKGFGK